MNPKIEAAIAVFQRLSPAEREQVLQKFAPSSGSNAQKDIENLNNQFWQGISLEKLIETQTPVIFTNGNNIGAKLWPEEDSIEDFLTFLKEQRKTVT